MFKTFVLRLEGFGCLQSISQSQGAFVVKIQMVNARKTRSMRCSDECTFECCVPDKLVNLFCSLQDAVSKGQVIMLAFSANYKDCNICNCCAENDPDRILHFYAELNEVGCVYVDGIKHSTSDLLSNDQV